ncbi:MAG: tetratricopeptide repeat protein [Alphaproteobacteria bacterium]|nr:tetratricopeptide repeat protein [Alphaproteobacteria bacterium]
MTAAADDPGRLLAIAAEALKRGALIEAEQASRQVLDRHRGHPEALNLLGLTQLARDRKAEAIDAFRRAVGRAPKSALIRCNLAYAYRADGRLEDAVREAQRAVRLDPNLTAAHTVIGTSLADLDRPGAALDPLLRALEQQPGLGRVLLALAKSLRALGREDEAKARYEEAVAADPRFTEAWVGLGWLHVGQRRYEEAVRCFRAGLVAKRASRWWPDDGKPLPPPGPLVPINTPKLSHDIEQLAYLSGRGLLPAELAGIAADYAAAKEQIERLHGASATVMIPPSDLGPIAETYLRIVRWRETSRHEAPVLGDFDRAGAERRYAVKPGICWIDGLLTPRALEDLRRFCLESTIWNDVTHNFDEGKTRHAYLGTYGGDGFSAPLLFQIAEDLTRAMPTIFKDHRLTQMWAYKYEPRLEGIGIHGDNAAVNVNFWITPDEANLNPESGGLIVYPVEAPAAWDFDDYNKDRRKIRRFLESAGVVPVNIPYRQNRVVIFNSDLFHATAPLDFKPGYENRRVNVTMLFGKRF